MTISSSSSLPDDAALCCVPIRHTRRWWAEPNCNALKIMEKNEGMLEVLDLFQQIFGAVGVLDIGGVDDDAQQQAQAIDRDLALAPFDLLGGIVAARPPFSVVLTLWVSMIAAVGLACRPSLSRSVMTR